MKLYFAKIEMFESICGFFREMSAYLNSASFLPNGDDGSYPSKELIENSLKNKQLMVAETDGKIAAAVIINHDYDDLYNEINWGIDAEKEKVTVIHGLRVLPEFSRKGIAKTMMKTVIENCREEGQKAIRLDMIEGNIPAQKLYLGLNFEKRGFFDIEYDGVGAVPSWAYELVL